MLSVLDKIYVLKLKKSDGSDMTKHLNQYFPKTLYEFFEVEGKTVNKNEGAININLWKIMKHDYIDEIVLDITKNHIEMIKKAYDNDYNCVLFLEEDARIESTGSSQKLKRINTWLQTNKKWDIMYLGYCNWPYLVSFFITRDIVKVWSPVAAHSYILNRRGMQKILHYTEYGKTNINCHVDKMYTKIPNLQKYAIFPMISFQNKDPALFVKACDLCNIKISMKTASIMIQYISLLLPILLIVCIGFFLLRMVF